ncbi:glutamate--tRNA ligase [Mycoplasmopsis opalescens]|uniref:glutamate--tRNA ligase n=1 Tax=Mycoplasmopsis opalescens TaxID=114886 RepID=UPI0004A70050|nr:glutamate--tRNA ligase [Mycoplasmopsis opalescens]
MNDINTKIRTRYAPSPTGYLHIGGARTALFSYLFAKHYNGDFVFRLEDTDVKRNVVDGEKSQLENLAWLGIIPDESPFKPNKECGKYRQSEKLDRYKEIAYSLVEKGLAYKAYDNEAELEMQHAESEKKGIVAFKYDRNWLKLSEDEKLKRDEKGLFSIRFAMPKNENLAWKDLVRGDISFNSSDIGDWVIMKSDGYPTYNFAVVIDDHDMSISHVLRGEEHITNTPKQLVIYNALCWKTPEFGHLTVITNMEGKKLSKRDTSTKQFIEDYRNEGYVPEALFNFLTLLGWTEKSGKEIMSHDEIIKAFDPERLSKSPSKFDIQKMDWFSKKYFQNICTTELLEKLSLEDNEWSRLFVDTYKVSCTTFNELKKNLNIYTQTKQELTLTIPQENIDVIHEFIKQLDKNEFAIEGIQNAINETKTATNKAGKNLFMPIRIATTYEEHGPELAKAIYLFGKNLVSKRLEVWK